MGKDMLGRLLAASAALALASCGGGDGGSYVAFIPPQPPPPTPPPPTPTPPVPSPVIFPNITTNTDFAALGLLSNASGTPDSSLMRDGFSVKFDAASNSYLMGLPTQLPGSFVAQGDTASYWYGYIKGTPFDNVRVSKPSASNPDIQLTYTSFASANGYYTPALTFFAFGSATPASAIPSSGSATYDAHVAGSTVTSGGYGPFIGDIGGSATLQFDFGAGTLAGHFDPTLSYYAGPGFTNLTTANLGSYNFVNSVYGAGKTNFSGQLSISGASSPGAFDGQFTGPAAQELMARWTAPFLVPGTQQWSEMFGVWVAKKR